MSREPRAANEGTRHREGIDASRAPMRPVPSAASPWMDALRRLCRNRVAMLGLAILMVFALASLVAPWVAPYPYDKTDLPYGAKSPTWSHLLGTDELGRDVLTRVLYGARISFAVGI